MWPQGGPLKRVQSYITIPAFDVAVTWHGFSEIVAVYNFAASNNFVLTDVSALPTTPNYVLFVAFQLNSVVYRYKLCGTGGTFYFDTVNYNKQLIKKNFRLEVWSVADADVTETTARTLWTSVRGQVDYRFGSDYELVTNGGLVTDLSPAASFDLPFQDALLFRFIASDLLDHTNWPSSINSANVLVDAYNGMLTNTSSYCNNQRYVETNSFTTATCDFGGVYDIRNFFMVFRATLSVNNTWVIKFVDNVGTDRLTITMGPTTAPSGVNTTTITLTDDAANSVVFTQIFQPKFFILEVHDGYVFIYDLNGILLYQGSGLNGPYYLKVLELGDGSGASGRSIDIAEMFGYRVIQNFNTPADYSELFGYISNKYGNGASTLPLTFTNQQIVPSN